MADENGDTKVRFSLWSVLAFLVILAAACIGYLFNSQAAARDETRTANQQVCDRVTRLETNFSYVVQGIGEMKQTNREIIEALRQHEQRTLSAIRKGRD